MATLTETAYYSRKIIRWSIVGFIGLIIIRILFLNLVAYIRSTLPPPELKPNNAFGRLPAIVFPQNATPSGELTLNIQTISGTIPEASSAAKVYFMPKSKPNFLSVSKTQTFVGRIGFTNPPQQLGETSYRWIDTRNPLRTLEADTVSNHFLLNYAFVHDLSLFAEKQPPSGPAALAESETLLQTLGISPPDINLRDGRITYLKLVVDELQPTTSQSQADALRVDYWRKSFEGIPVVTDKPDAGIVTFILGSSRRSDRRFLLGKFDYWPVDTRTFGIYKLKTSDAAWSELQMGNAYYASLPQNQQVNITNIYLAYYDSRDPQLFLQPVFVFEGDPKFVAYIPAIAPPWTE